jgi:hypothetical protein
MARNDRLAIPSSVHSVVFRRLDKIVRRDAVVARTFAVIRSWEGKDDDHAGFAPDECPALRLTPGAGPDGWYGPSGFESTLTVDCEVYAIGTNAEDILDLVQVVRLALYPADPAACLAIQQALKADGASETGQPLLGTPGVAVALNGDAAMMQATFAIQIDTLNTLNA